MALKQPVTQVRLTNVAVVRLKLGGERFEIACYKNKVLNWREGKETDLNEVLQVDVVFQNVAKGELARKAELQRYFGTDDQKTCILRILEKGDLQVSELERRQQLQQMFNDVVSCVVDLTYSAVTGLPLSRSAVSSALKELGFAVRLKQPAKAQALHAALLLQQHNPQQIRRRLMKLTMLLPLPPATAAAPAAPAAAAASMLHFILRDCAGFIESQDPTVDLLLQQKQHQEGEADAAAASTPIQWRVAFLASPGVYRELEEKVLDAGGSLAVATWNCLYDPQQDQHLLQQQRRQQQEQQKMLEQLQQQEQAAKEERERQGKEQQRRAEKAQHRKLMRRLRQQQQDEEQQRLEEQRVGEAMKQEQARLHGRLLQRQILEEEYLEGEMVQLQLQQLRRREEEEERRYQLRRQQQCERQLELIEQHNMQQEDPSFNMEEMQQQQQLLMQQQQQQQVDTKRVIDEFGFGPLTVYSDPEEACESCSRSCCCSRSRSQSNSRSSSTSSENGEEPLCCCCCAEFGDDAWEDTQTRAQRKGRGGRKQRQQQQQQQRRGILLSVGLRSSSLGSPCPLHAAACTHQRYKNQLPSLEGLCRPKQHSRRRQLQQQQKKQERASQQQQQPQQQHQRRLQKQQQRQLRKQQHQRQREQQQQQRQREQQQQPPEFDDSLTRDAFNLLCEDTQPRQHQQGQESVAGSSQSLHQGEQPQPQHEEQRVFRCRCCNEAMKDAAELREHCKSSRHAVNLRRQLQSLPPLTGTEWTEAKFDQELMAGSYSEVRGF